VGALRNDDALMIVCSVIRSFLSVTWNMYLSGNGLPGQAAQQYW